MIRTLIYPLLLICLIVPVCSYGQKNNKQVWALKKQAINDIEPHYEEYKKTTLEMWYYAGVGLKEVKSTA